MLEQELKRQQIPAYTTYYLAGYDLAVLNRVKPGNLASNSELAIVIGGWSLLLGMR